MSAAGLTVPRPCRPQGSPGSQVARRARYKAVCPEQRSHSSSKHGRPVAASLTAAAVVDTASVAHHCNLLHDALGRLLEGRAAQRGHLCEMLNLLIPSPLHSPIVLDSEPATMCEIDTAFSIIAEADANAELDSSVVEHFDLTACDVSEDDLEASYDELEAPWCMSSNAGDEFVADAAASDDGVDEAPSTKGLTSHTCSAPDCILELGQKPCERADDTVDEINSSVISTIAGSDAGGLSGTSFASCAQADWSVLSQDNSSNLLFLGVVNYGQEALHGDKPCLVTAPERAAGKPTVEIAAMRQQPPEQQAFDLKTQATASVLPASPCVEEVNPKRRHLQLRHRAILSAATPARSVVLAFKPRP